MPRAAQALLFALVVLVAAISAVVLGVFDSRPDPASASATYSPVQSAAASDSALGSPSPVAAPSTGFGLPSPAASQAAPILTPAIESPAATAPATAAPTVLPTVAPTAAPTTQPSPSQAPPIAGDAVTDPISVVSVPSSTDLRVRRATSAATDPDCYPAHRSVWFAYTADQGAELMATTTGSDYDTTLYLGRRLANGQLEHIDCNDDAVGGQSAIRFTAEAGATYYFMVGAYSSTPGGSSLIFNLEPAPPPVTISLNIHDSPTFDEDGTLTIRGDVTCSARTSDVSISVEVRQRVDRLVFQGWGESELRRCGPSAREWLAVVTSYNGTFGEEVARVTGWASACNAYDCASAQAVVDVQPMPGFAPSPSPSPPSSPLPPAGGDE